MLLAIGPIFILDVPSSNITLFMLGLHLETQQFSHEWARFVVDHGVLRNIISTLSFPIYIWITFSVLRNRTPRIFCRLGFGIVLYFIAILYALIIDVVGHTQHLGSNSECIFNFTFNDTSDKILIPHIGMHWAVYIPVNLLCGVGPTLVTVTLFEFISAQSPHSMKGLLVGTYFAISGVYQFFSSVLLMPFSSYGVWAGGHYPPRTGCLFGYFVCTLLIALIGLILFFIAARWYVYRERDDRPYDQRFVIDFYDKYLEPDPPSFDYESD